MCVQQFSLIADSFAGNLPYEYICRRMFFIISSISSVIFLFSCTESQKLKRQSVSSLTHGCWHQFSKLREKKNTCDKCWLMQTGARTGHTKPTWLSDSLRGQMGWNLMIISRLQVGRWELDPLPGPCTDFGYRFVASPVKHGSTRCVICCMSMVCQCGAH